eukprot:5516664-Amphidinium_carterae.1
MEILLRPWDWGGVGVDPRFLICRGIDLARVERKSTLEYWCNLQVLQNPRYIDSGDEKIDSDDEEAGAQP